MVKQADVAKLQGRCMPCMVLLCASHVAAADFACPEVLRRVLPVLKRKEKNYAIN